MTHFQLASPRAYFCLSSLSSVVIQMWFPQLSMSGTRTHTQIMGIVIICRNCVIEGRAGGWGIAIVPAQHKRRAKPTDQDLWKSKIIPATKIIRAQNNNRPVIKERKRRCQLNTFREREWNHKKLCSNAGDVVSASYPRWDIGCLSTHKTITIDNRK